MAKSSGFKFKIIRFIICVIAFIVLWIAGDYLYSTFITHNGFIFTVDKDILKPLIFAIPTAAFAQLLHYK